MKEKVIKKALLGMGILFVIFMSCSVEAKADLILTEEECVEQGYKLSDNEYFYYKNMGEVTYVRYKDGIKGNYILEKYGCYDVEKHASDVKKLKEYSYPDSFNPDEIHLSSDNAVAYRVNETNSFVTSMDGVLYSKDYSVLIRYPEKKAGTSFDVPSIVKKIGDGDTRNGVFENNENLESINMGEGITIIGACAFRGMKKIKSLYIPKSVTYIYGQAIENCDNLEELGIENVTQAMWICKGCPKLKRIYYGAGVKEYTASVSNLEEFIVDKSNPYLCSENGVLFDKSKERLLQYPSSKQDSTYIIPSTVKVIEEAAFYNVKYLEKCIIPDAVNKIYFENYETKGGTHYKSFECCLNLKNIIVDKGNANYSSNNGVVFNKNGTELLQYPDGKEESCYVVNSNVKKIGITAFTDYNISLNELVFLNDSIEILRLYYYKGDSKYQGYISARENSKALQYANDNGLKSKIIVDLHIPEHISVYCNGKELSSEDIIYKGDSLRIIANVPNRKRLVSLQVNGKEIESGEDYIVNENNTIITYQMEDLPETYTIIFDSSGGSKIDTIADIEKGSKISLPPQPTRKGYIFKGWFNEPNGQGEEFTSETPINGNMILYAYWMAEETQTEDDFGSNDNNNSSENVIVTLNAKSVPLQLKKSTTAIKATVMKGDKVISWESSNKGVATVNSKGKITAKRLGKAQITAITEKGAKATVTVKVQKNPVKINKIKVNKKAVKLKSNQSYNLKVSKFPITAQEKIKYVSSNVKIATINSKGKIVAKKKGKTTIKVKCGNKTVKVNVVVK